MAIMAAPLLATFIMAILGHIVGKIILMIGFAAVTYAGLSTGLNFLEGFVQDQFGGLPDYMVQLMGILQLDTAIAIIMGALIARWAIVMIGGTLTRLRFLPGAGSIFS